MYSLNMFVHNVYVLICSLFLYKPKPLQTKLCTKSFKDINMYFQSILEAGFPSWREEISWYWWLCFCLVGLTFAEEDFSVLLKGLSWPFILFPWLALWLHCPISHYPVVIQGNTPFWLFRLWQCLPWLLDQPPSVSGNLQLCALRCFKWLLSLGVSLRLPYLLNVLSLPVTN